jgi:lipopolysaccharide export system permease protein
MKILDRYIAKTLLKYSLSVMVILVGIFAFFKFLEEADDIGKMAYTLSSALAYIGLLIPSIVYTLFSIIILLGVVLGLGHLASNSELVIMKGSGLSILDITKITLKVSAVFALIVIIIGESLSPIMSEYAQQYRSEALGKSATLSNQQGFWIRDNDNFIHVNKNINGQSFSDITIVRLSKAGKMESVVHSDYAVFDGSSINLKQSNFFRIDHDKKLTVIEQQDLQQYTTEVNFDQEFINSLKKEPKSLSTWQLFRHITFLSNNSLSADEYEIEFYSRVVKPLTLLTMIILSIPFVFGSLRDASLGKKIFMAIVLSLFFWLSSRLGAQLSLFFDMDHFLSASLPTMVVFIIAILRLYRLSAR